MNAFPRKGERYTVRDIIPAQGWGGEHTCAVLLEELSNRPDHRGEPGFACHRFREVDAEEVEEEFAESEGEEWKD